MNIHDYNKRRRVLFICKSLHEYGSNSPLSRSIGLRNSAQIIVHMLKKHHINAHLVNVVDGNGIDREVTKHKPTIVILEAVWCPPDKLAELQRLHPRVEWLVRVHSELPFLAGEGMAVQWLQAYAHQPEVLIAANSDRMASDLAVFLSADKIVYAPNYYPLAECPPKPMTTHYGRVQVGCFGALRPLKNQLASAVAAIEFGHRINRSVDFHVNGNRCEGGGENILKNLRSLFAGVPAHRLIEHPWLDLPGFLELVRSMDLGLQVSLSETFNLVAADFVAQMVPIVVSEEVRWLPSEFKADPHSTALIAHRMEKVWHKRFVLPFEAYGALEVANAKAVSSWINLFNLPVLHH